MNLKTAIKVIVTSGLMLYLISKLDLFSIYEVLMQVNLVFLVFTLPFIVFMFLMKARKWQLLLKCIDIQLPVKESLKIILMGTFYGVLTPGKAGEISRAFYLDTEKSKGIATVIIDRVIDVICLLILSVFVTILYFNDQTLVHIMILVIPFFLAGIYVIVNEKIMTVILNIFLKNTEHTINYVNTIKLLTNDKKTLLHVFTLSFGYYALNLIVYWLIIKSLNPSLNTILAFSLPVIIIMGNIPISISGFGVREFTSVIIFEMLNVDSTYGFSSPILLYLFTIIFPALFGFLLTFQKR